MHIGIDSSGYSLIQYQWGKVLAIKDKLNICFVLDNYFLKKKIIWHKEKEELD